MKTALITGGSRGIGLATCHSLAREGFQIVAPARTELDLSDASSLAAYLDRNSGLAVDVLVNNAGINRLAALDSIADADWQVMLQTNLTAPLKLAQAFLPGMRKRSWGRVLNVSSIFSVVTKENRAAYSMTKAALNAMVRSIALEYGPHGVLANAMCPGYVDTELTRENNSPAALEMITGQIPLGRLASVEELANTAAFLCSERNTYLTGQEIAVDGGFLCQ